MKITRIEALHLRLPNVNERCDGSQETLVVKVHTDAGFVGLGEADTSSLVARAKLANKGFVDRAPAEVVQQQRELAADLEKQIKVMEDNLRELRQA